MSSQYSISSFNQNLNYKQNDIVYGIYDGATIHASPYFYATQNSIGQHPSGVYVYSVTSVTSAEDIVTVNYTQTGNVPNVAPGSFIMVAGTASNYSGMALDGASGHARYIFPGWDDTQGAGGTVTMRNPAWTTGFCWAPDYSSKVGTENKAIVVQLGDGYSQRMPQNVNSFAQTLNFTFRNRGNREMKAITNYVQNTAGSNSFEIFLADQYMNNQPHQKWISPSVESTPVSWGRWDINMNATRVFDL